MIILERIRHLNTMPLLSYGFRPFFLFGASWAALAMLLWILMLSGSIHLPVRHDPVSWHAHEFLFGYLGAIIAGFLLTAVPSWTGRQPLTGWPLATLFLVWVLGRICTVFSAAIPGPIPAAVDLLFPVLLAGLILREIIAGKNWRNLVVFVLLSFFGFANLLFHIEAASGANAAQGIGLRIGVATVLMMICVIGGRIIPSFTRNWLVAKGQDALPALPMQRFDRITLLVTAITLVFWVSLPLSPWSGAALVVMGGLHLARLLRWKGYRALSEPLLWVLHLGYLFVPLGALIEGIAIVWPELLTPGAAQHLWMAGGFALMTLAVMSRATLGHTGQELRAGKGSVVMFMCIIGSVAGRISANLWPDMADTLYILSAVLWIAAFLGFCLLYGAAFFKSKS